MQGSDMSMRRLATLALASLVLASCSSGPVRRISEPSTSLQQLSVRADGQWDVQLRVQNYSTVAMRFAAADIEIAFDNGSAARVQAQPQLLVGPESADVYTATLRPTAAGRARIATALADGRGLNYTLAGTMEAAPEDGSSRSYKIKLSSALTPVPGLPGVLR
jgi:hypothetical protein